MADTFALDVSRFVEKAKIAPAVVVRKLGLDLASSVVLGSPVDTGRFRANWNIAFGAPDESTSQATDKSGGQAINRVRAQLAGFNEPVDIYLTNSLPYAIPLEYGSSKQAPQGMVRITVAKFQSFVDAAARSTQ